MATNALFISEEYLKTWTPTSGNVDAIELMPFVRTAQEKYCKLILGSKLYDRLVAGVIASNLNSNETLLITLLQPMVAWRAVYEYMPFAMMKLKNKGLQKNASADAGSSSAGATIEEMRYLRNETETQADFYLQRVQDFLLYGATPGNGGLTGTAMFPEYATPYNPVFPDMTTSYNGDIVFDEMDEMYLDYRFYRRFLAGDH